MEILLKYTSDLRLVGEVFMKSGMYNIKQLDHLGLVAGMCKELGIAEFIDNLMPNQSSNKHISYGETVVAMILNGLGFTARTLHMFPEYHSNKPLDTLIRSGIKSEHVNDKVLGRTLDKLYQLGVSDIYSALAQKVVKKLKLPCKSAHLDTTSFHVDGEYKSNTTEETADEEEERCIKICHGYSRDHRPDLKQAILLMITENKAGIPIFMQPTSGNVNDTSSFNRFIKEHLKSMKSALNNRYLVADAALYSSKNIKKIDDQKQYFITRVPASLKEASELINQSKPLSFDSLDQFPGYKVAETTSEYGDVSQRWFLFHSDKAHKRELQTLNRRMLKQSKKEMADLNKLCKTNFSCEQNAKKAFDTWIKSAKYCKAEMTISQKASYKQAGRPKKNSPADGNSYFINADPFIELSTREEKERALGYFILATNDCDTVNFTASDVLENYKSQQQVERGFRFLKDPAFLVSSLFLKKPERIEAMLMIMTLCLMIYAAIQHRIRYELKNVFPI